VLEATLLAYVRQDYSAIPALRMIYTPAEEIRQRAEAFVADIPQADLKIEVIEGRSVIGGGTAPTATLPTFLIALSSLSLSAEELQDRMRRQSPPVIARIEHDRVLLDLRTVFPEEEEKLSVSLCKSMHERS
jgi:L-seryl-tRNA(Ser) seleniumtransferase